METVWKRWEIKLGTTDIMVVNTIQSFLRLMFI